jgi:ribonuclease E
MARRPNQVKDMAEMLINATQAEELRVVLVDDNKVLYDYITERPGFEEKIGNMYLAEITSIEPSLDAVFVNFGSKRHGFLPLKEIAREYYSSQDPEKLERPNIKELLKEGQKILVQVEKEERGNKGAALTTFISLAGSYIVLMPNNPRAGGISRRIEGDDRDELREILSQLDIPSGMGLIVRTAGVGRSFEELKWDLNVLLNYWEAIKKASLNRSAPLLIHQESDVVIRAIRDYLRQDIKEIIIDNPNVFDKAKHYIEQVRPDYTTRLKLYTEKVPLFIRYEIEHQIELAYQRTVRLKSGGSLVIDHTEALVSIDINSARATKGGDIEETAFNTNLEAAEEIARQLRLRDIGGLIVIDFIDMISIRHQREVENVLREALKSDRARVQIGRISRFGLLEMSRQRLRPSLQEIQEICPRCNGQGAIRSVDSLASSIIRMIEEDSMKENTAQIQLQLSNEAATYLLNEKRSIITDIEQRQHVSIVIIPNPNIQYPNYQIKRLRKTDLIEQTNKLQQSYKLIQTSEMELPSKKPVGGKMPDQPVVKNLLPSLPPAPIPKKPMQGLIKRLWSSMFSSTASKEKETTAPARSYTHAKPYPPRSKPHGKQRPRGSHKVGHRPQKGDFRHTSERTISTGGVEAAAPSSYKPTEKISEAPRKERRAETTRAPGRKHHHKHYQREERRRPETQPKPAPEQTEPIATSKLEPTEPKVKPSSVEREITVKEEQAPIIIRPDVKKEQETKPKPTHTTENETDKS